jgi:hypothetical protein
MLFIFQFKTNYLRTDTQKQLLIIVYWPNWIKVLSWLHQFRQIHIILKFVSC